MSQAAARVVSRDEMRAVHVARDAHLDPEVRIVGDARGHLRQLSAAAGRAGGCRIPAWYVIAAAGVRKRAYSLARPPSAS